MTGPRRILAMLCAATLVGFCALWAAELILLFACPGSPLAATHAAEAVGLASAAFWVGRNWETN